MIDLLRTEGSGTVRGIYNKLPVAVVTRAHAAWTWARDFTRMSERPLGMWEGWCQWILTVHILNYTWICLRSIPICDIFITPIPRTPEAGVLHSTASFDSSFNELRRDLITKKTHAQRLADKPLCKPWTLTDVFSGIFFGLVEHFTHVLFVAPTRIDYKNKGAVDNVNSTCFSLSIGWE